MNGGRALEVAPATALQAALLAASLFAVADAAAQDAARGARLFAETQATTGRQVGNCVACHANVAALREMIRNRGGRTDDARSIAAVMQRAIDGAQPGAADAKAQYRGVLTPQDLRDLAAYLARARPA
jgi:mono/diheme cytochrome c family protein